MAPPVLVTGASGRLGRAVARHAQVSGVPTVLWNRRLDLSLGSDLQVQLEMTDASAVDRRSAEASPRAVIHLAAMTGARCEQDPQAAHAINVAATLQLAQGAAAAGATRFVFASSAAVYGDAYARPMLETDSLVGRGTYAATKIAAEEGIAAIGLESGMEIVILRIFNLYGDGLGDSLIHRLQNASADAPATLRGTADFVRDYVHIDDVAAACLAACHVPIPEPCTTINVASGVATSNADLLAAMDPQRRQYVTVSPGVPSHSQADVSRMREILAMSARPLGTRL